MATWFWINIPLMVLAFALWVGIPMWMVLWRPDRDPRETRTVPAYLRQRGAMAAAFPGRRPAPAYVQAEQRELVSSGRS